MSTSLGELRQSDCQLPTLEPSVRRRPRSVAVERAADYLELTKPKIAVLELVTVAVAAFLAGPNVVVLVHALIGTALVAASASALNHWFERSIDLRMERTRNRPLPAGRMSAGEVFALGILLVVIGTAYLAIQVNLLTAGLGLLSWALYVLVYTPLKSRTPANTMVGAVAGALPVLMGWSAMSAPFDLQAGALFLIVFLWQFPHFMAIAWIYRDEYERAGLVMLTVVDPTGVRAGAQAVVASLALLPVSLIPAVLPTASNVVPYFLWATLLGVGLLSASVAFLFARNLATARWLLRASLLYLPALLMVLILASVA